MNQLSQISTRAEPQMANAIRALTMDAVEAANSGHPGMPMGMADVAAVLFNRYIKIDPSAPKWSDRDRFVLSAGHGSMMLYAINHLLGYQDMGMDQIRAFRQMGSHTAGHPEYGHADGIETTTGPLGQGLATATGMALAERMLNARFGDDLVDHYTYVMAGDGCLMEGISHEAIDMAGHLRLGRLILLWDDNRITIDGGTELSTSTKQTARFEASGWHVQEINGHDFEEIAKAITAARADPRPSMIACRTLIGYGAPNKQGSSEVHGAPLGGDEIAATRKALGWLHEAFSIPDEIYVQWHNILLRGAEARKAWDERLSASSVREQFVAGQQPVDNDALNTAIAAYKSRLSADAPLVATRKASEMALEVINKIIPNTVGGSADLTGSNNTRTKGQPAVQADDYGGRYIHYGIREHAMAAAMNGLALHGGLRPYGGTFLAFADYARGAIRLSALMGVPVTYVLTHDSIGLGEDGPTHQPVEHLASLRAIPNLNVIRPADAVETAEAWALAVTENSTPTALILSRQNLPLLRSDHTDTNLTSRGAYVLSEPEGRRDVTLIASGSEVQIAVDAVALLGAKGIRAAVVSAPCFEMFAIQSPDYRCHVRGNVPRIGIEAAVRQGWELFLERSDPFIGMTGFGASGPAEELYRHFGITPEAVTKTAAKHLEKQAQR